MATMVTNLPLKLFHTPDFDAISNGSQYSSDLEALGMVWCDHTNILIGCKAAKREDLASSQGLLTKAEFAVSAKMLDICLDLCSLINIEK
jgi:hypothetical protein